MLKTLVRKIIFLAKINRAFLVIRKSQVEWLLNRDESEMGKFETPAR